SPPWVRRSRALVRFSAVARIAGSALGTILVASLVIYGALSLAPGDPATMLAGSRATPTMIAEIRRQYGLNRAFPIRYWSWLTNALHGNFGISLQFHQSVSSLLAPRILTTVELVAYAALVIMLLGIGLGLLPSALPRLNIAVTVTASLGIAVPAFVAALVLVEIFALKLGWFPAVGPGTGGFMSHVRHLTLPAFALAFSWAAYVAQISRASVREEQSREHVATATGRGLAPTAVFRRHVLRNAAVPIVTVSGLTVAGLLAGSIVVETAFGLGGIGSLLVQSVSAKDYNVVLAISLILVVAFVLATTIADLAHLALDPRVRTRVTA
ncbi:MAG: ABC transporter permease, partial [Streptosporangiaceae bacterium]